MAAIGAFNTILNRTLQRPNVIYRSPNTPPTGGPTSPPTSGFPINRLPTSPPPQPRIPPTVPSSPPPDTNPWQVPTEQPPGGTGPSSPANPPPTSPTEPPTTGSGPGTGTGGGSETGRLIDLLANAFQPQDISQPFGPTSVSSTPDSGGGPNPMAILVLAILAIAGVFLYVHRKGKRA